MEEKLQALVETARLQSEVGSLFVNAETAKASGDYAAAQSVYQDLIERSHQYLEAAVDFNTRFPESPFDLHPIVRPLCNALMVDADIVYALGERAAAETLRDEALRLSRAYLGRRGTADLERSRASSFTLEGRFNEAIVALMNVRDVVLESGDMIGVARNAIDLADIFQWLGDFQRAQEEIDHAASIVEPIIGDRGITQSDVLRGAMASVASIMAGKGDSGEGTRNAELHRAFIEITYYRGLIAKALGQWEEAERDLNCVLPEYRALGAGEGIDFQLAVISLNQGKYAEALNRAQAIAPIFERGDFRPKLGVFQKLLAECHHGLGNSGTALQLIDASIQDFAHNHFDPDALWRSQRLQARIYSDTGDRTRALQSWRAAIATVSQLRRAPLGYRLDSTFLSDKKEMYSQAIADAAEAGEAADCCYFIEGIKSRTLNAVLSIPRSRNDLDSELGARFDTITQQLDAIEYQAYREGWTVERTSTHQGLLRQRADLLERIRISDRRWRTLSQPLPLDLDSALRVLAGRSQAALTLYYDPPNICAVLLYGGKLRIGQLTVPDDLPPKLADYAKNLRKAQPDPFKHDLSAQYKIKATDLIPASLLTAAMGARSLVVIPHEILHLVPWSALIHQGKRLFERLPVGILPNLAAAVTEEKISKPRNAALLGVGHYPGLKGLQDLPSTYGEIEDISNLYRDGGVAVSGPLLDADATEVAFWNLVKQGSGTGNLIHASCHGMIVRNEPMNSGLLLFDSKVDAAEVARAALPFDEVVLSACNTGWRPTEVGDVELTADEILGIPAGFLEAGVKVVLVSIPKAEGKATRALTTEYHRRRVAGESPLSAFQGAQNHMLESGAPGGTWMGLTLYGCV